MAQPKIFKNSFFYILILVFLLRLNSVFGDNCLRCGDFNRKSGRECALDAQRDCGPCLTGFLQDEDDSRLCFALEILENGESSEIEENGNYYLPCAFNTKVDCFWYRDEAEVTIAGHQQDDNIVWSGTDDGKNTDECSINLRNFSEKEVGNYVCSNLANSAMDSVKSEIIQLSLKSKVVEHPKALYNVLDGDDVTVSCKFSQQGACSWSRDGRPVKSTERYRYTEKDTRDCSLTIASFDKKRDEGFWTCVRPSTSLRDAIPANRTHLTGFGSGKNQRSTKSPPKINVNRLHMYLRNERVDGSTLQYNGQSNKKELSQLRCVNEESNSAAQNTMFWLLRTDREYSGSRIESNILTTDEDLVNQIITRLQNGNSVQLVCVMEDENKVVTSSLVNIIAVPGGQNLLLTAGYENIRIILIIFVAIIVIFLALLIALFVFALRWNMQKKNNLSDPS